MHIVRGINFFVHLHSIGAQKFKYCKFPIKCEEFFPPKIARGNSRGFRISFFQIGFSCRYNNKKNDGRDFILLQFDTKHHYRGIIYTRKIRNLQYLEKVVFQMYTY